MIHHFVIIGLILDLAGAIMLFNYGLPSNVESVEVGFIMEQESPRANEIRLNNQKIFKKAKIGLGLVVAGFAFQLVGVLYTHFVNIIPKNTREKSHG